ncbi:MAG: carboxypeptidase regulatory-like domain-containing protein, partial [Bacteroidia bacterium]|nr:carboxypeptidase regulatory-like domain-containing protein [Bacteroidia bacterium]
MKYAIIALAALFVSNLSAQQFTQTIRGRVTESETRQPIGGAKLELISLAEATPVFTDSLGNFEFTAVQVGRHMLSISAEGYSPTTISDIILNSAKEVVLNIELTAKVVSIAEARIKAGKNDPAKTNNDLVTVSGRQFTIDQTNRYAGSLGDPSRMAS